MRPRKNQTIGNSKVKLLQEVNFASTSNCRQVSSLTVTLSPELSTDLCPPVTYLLPIFQVLSEPKLLKKTLIRKLVEEKPTSSISEVPTAMNLPACTVWNILRKTLRKYTDTVNLKLSTVLPINRNCVGYNLPIGFFSKTKNSVVTLYGLMKSCGWKNERN